MSTGIHVHGASVYSRLTASVPKAGTGPTVTQTRINQQLMTNKWIHEIKEKYILNCNLITFTPFYRKVCSSDSEQNFLNGYFYFFFNIDHCVITVYFCIYVCLRSTATSLFPSSNSDYHGKCILRPDLTK